MKVWFSRRGDRVSLSAWVFVGARRREDDGLGTGVGTVWRWLVPQVEAETCGRFRLLFDTLPAQWEGNRERPGVEESECLGVEWERKPWPPL